MILNVCIFFPGQSLKVKSLNLEASDNRHEHHTSVYDQEDAIFRRGQDFSLTVIFNRAPKAQDDVIIVQVVTGKRVTNIIIINAVLLSLTIFLNLS